MIYWKELYQEIAKRIEDNLEEIKFIDLWHEQISYLTEELEFPTPAVFVDFSTTSTDDLGELVQQGEIQVDMRLFYETFSDTYSGSVTQDMALEFLDTLTKLHALFHGKSGETFSQMRRISMTREESGGAGNLYRISFLCSVVDYSAKVLFTEGEFTELEISQNKEKSEERNDVWLYHIK